MKSGPRHLLLLLAALLLSACLPEERIWWSPQGDRALVLVSDKLHLVNADGELGPPLAGLSLEHSLVKTLSWLPDGSGFVCERVRICRTWAEARTLIPEEESAAVERMVPVVPPLLTAAAKLAGDAKSLDDIAAALPLKDSKKFATALLVAHQKDPAPLETLLLSLPEGKKIVQNLSGDDAGFQVSELCLIRLDAGKGVEIRSWKRSLLKPSAMPKVSPTQGVVACFSLDDDDETLSLEVLPIDGGPGVVVAQRVSAAFDWTPDGRSLVFLTPVGGNEEKVQSIHRITVLREDGTLINTRDDEKDAPAAQNAVTLATALVLNRPVLQVLPDGRVLFASQPATLPFTGAEPESGPHLHVISADGKRVQPVPTAPGDLPADLGYFAASPDGKFAAVVESETDAVAVVELATGRTQIISPPHPRWQCETIPAWKSATELTFAALHGAADEPKWMLWTQDAGVRCISGKWPASATEDWLEHKKPDPEQEPTPVHAKPDGPR